MHRFSVLKLCTSTERVSYFFKDARVIFTYSHYFSPFWPLKVTPVSNKYKTITIINSSHDLGVMLYLARTSRASWITCILQNEAIPFQFGDIGDWSVESSTNVSVARLLNDVTVTLFKWLGKFNAQFLKISWSDFPEIFTIGRGH